MCKRHDHDAWTANKAITTKRKKNKQQKKTVSSFLNELIYSPHQISVYIQTEVH